MEKKVIISDSAPAAIGPYSQAIKITEGRGIIFCSGQIPLDPATGNIIGKNISDQTEQAILNLRGVLEAAGVDLSRVVKTTVYLRNMDDFSEMNKVYETFFSEDYPARAAIEVSRLPKNVLVEIEAIAIL